MVLVELYAGTAALTLSYFDQGPYPVRMGNKGKAAARLRAEIGGTVEGVILCEIDPHARLLCRSYFEPELFGVAYEQLHAWRDEAPLPLWERCRTIVLEERRAGTARDLAAWVVAASWSVTKGAYQSCNGSGGFSYAGPGKVTKTGNKPVCIGDTARMAQRLAFVGDIPHAVFADAEHALPLLADGGAVVYADPPYTWDRDGCYNTGSNYKTCLELVDRQPCETWVSSGEALTPESYQIAETAFSHIAKPDFLTHFPARP